MAKGKQTCKILKEIRKQIAAENDINLVIEECTYQGDCKGTCPKCEAEVRYLERELEKRQRMGKAAIFAGMTIGTAITAAGCGPLAPTPNGMMENPRDTIAATDTIRNDSVEEPVLLEGDVVGLEADTVENDKRTACKSSEPLKIPGDVIVVDEAVGEDVTEGFVESFAPSPIEGEVEDPENDVYQIVQEMPEFPGGQEALDKYIQENLRCGEMINKYQVDAVGKIFVGFIIEPDGSITNVRVIRGLYKHYDEEAIRVVESMPKWKPGMQNGKPVRVSYMIPIHFKSLQ